MHSAGPTKAAKVEGFHEVHLERGVISTEATDSITVRRAVERPPHLPLPLFVLAVILNEVKDPDDTYVTQTAQTFQP